MWGLAHCLQELVHDHHDRTPGMTLESLLRDVHLIYKFQGERK